MDKFLQVTGTPFRGTQLERIKEFLNKEELEYDESIEYTVIFENEDEIIATGSCHGNVMKCIAISKEYQGRGILAEIIMQLVYYMVSKGISHYFIFTKPKNQKIFEDMSFHSIAKTKEVLLMENKKNGIKAYLQRLKNETSDISISPNDKGEGIGAIVANCNPFTYGHKYLMEIAASQCKYLHVFILSQDNQVFEEEERFRMVQEGTSHIKNIILHKASDYTVSPAVFPTYFIKDKVKAEEINCMLDLTIFCEYIVPTLNITKRFVGNEPICKVTNKYNRCMEIFLPQHGVEYNEIERKEKSGIVISASYIREMMKTKNYDKIEKMVPDVTMKYIRDKEMNYKNYV